MSNFLNILKYKLNYFYFHIFSGDDRLVPSGSSASLIRVDRRLHGKKIACAAANAVGVAAAEAYLDVQCELTKQDYYFYRTNNSV